MEPWNSSPGWKNSDRSWGLKNGSAWEPIRRSPSAFGQQYYRNWADKPQGPKLSPQPLQNTQRLSINHPSRAKLRNQEKGTHTSHTPTLEGLVMQQVTWNNISPRDNYKRKRKRKGTSTKISCTYPKSAHYNASLYIRTQYKWEYKWESSYWSLPLRNCLRSTPSLKISP